VGSLNLQNRKNFYCSKEEGIASGVGSPEGTKDASIKGPTSGGAMPATSLDLDRGWGGAENPGNEMSPRGESVLVRAYRVGAAAQEHDRLKARGSTAASIATMRFYQRSRREVGRKKGRETGRFQRRS